MYHVLHLQTSACWLAQIFHCVACTQASFCRRFQTAWVWCGFGLLFARTALAALATCSTSCCLAADGWEQWHHRFEAPPVAAYAASSGQVDLLAPGQQQRAAVSSGISAGQPGYAALLPASNKASTLVAAAQEAVVLVAQNNSVYAIPAAHLAFEAVYDSASASGEQCDVPVVERLAVEQRRRNAPGEGSELALFDQQKLLQPEQLATAAETQQQQCRPADAGTCAAATLGVYAVHKHGSSSLLLLPPAANDSTSNGPPPQQGRGNQDKAAWLVLLAGAGLGAAASVALLLLFVQRGTGAGVAEQQAVSTAADSNRASMDTAGPEAGSSRQRRKMSSTGKRPQQQQMSNRMKGIMQQAAAEGARAQPQAAAAAGVVELQDQQHKDDTLPSSAAIVAGLRDSAMRRRELQDGVILIGRLRVSASTRLVWRRVAIEQFCVLANLSAKSAAVGCASVIRPHVPRTSCDNPGGA